MKTFRRLVAHRRPEVQAEAQKRFTLTRSIGDLNCPKRCQRADLKGKLCDLDRPPARRATTRRPSP